MTWLDLRALVKYAQQGSAIHRAVNPDWWVTPELVFLRDVEFNLRWLMWAKTKDGQKNINRPKPVPLTKAEQKAARPERDKYDAKPIAETLAFLGWTDDMNRREAI